MRAGWSARSPTISANSCGNVSGEATAEAGDRVRPVPRLGGGRHHGEPAGAGTTALGRLDHDPQRRRRVDPAGARAAADVRLVRDLGTGGDVGVAVALVVVAHDGQVVQAVAAAWEHVAEDAGFVVL